VTTRLTEFDHDGYRFDVRDSGPVTGPVIIALHGFPQLGSCWAAVTPPLTAAGYRVLAPDQRGYSPRARPRSIRAYTTEHLTTDVLALAEAAGTDTFHLLGHDWGAAVAWQIASVYPNRVRTLTAVSVPHPAAFRAAMAGTQLIRSLYMLFFQIPALPEYALRAGNGGSLRWAMTWAGSTYADDAVRLMADPRAATAAINWYRALRFSFNFRPAKVHVPTLYVWSDRDVALGRRGATGTQKWVDGPYQFKTLAGASHWIPQERPDELAELVLSHLAEYGGQL
jgi:pimeloyl-ACP methyl ester carboxylesterase